MAAERLTREQRLRLQAELQSLYGTLANLREREYSYMNATATVPTLFRNQLNDVRRQIAEVERQLFQEEEPTTTEARGRRYYAEGFAAELAGDLDTALKFYRRAARFSHADGNQAARSVRYHQKVDRIQSTPAWVPGVSPGKTRNRVLLVLAVLVILLAVAVFVTIGLNTGSPQTVAAEVTVTATVAQTVVQLVIPNTPTPLPTSTPTPQPPPPTNTPEPAATPTPTQPPATPAPAPTRTPAPTLRPAPKIVGPRDGLVWLDGAVVFEFEPLDLAYDELYCLNTLRGYDYTETENWSYSPVGSKQPSIVVDANVFKVAKVQGMQCIKWSASIGKGSCENAISRSTVERVIGLPRPCDF